ncbi:MAG TPA: proline dehydrogenase family protein [Anaerolineales bacterium]|nr:proline dehydrogenase family protein [Anaerolineales bacterium]
MLRALFIYLSHSKWAYRFITSFRLTRQAALRFIAGDKIEDAIAVICALNAKGIHATLDRLGESVTNQADAARAADDYVLALDEIAKSGARSNVSVKLTQLGLDVDYDFCLHNVRRVVERAKATGNFVRIDMEGTPHTDRTLAIFRVLHREFNNVGVVLQAYLYRTEQDLLALTTERARLRLCKGAYNEPPDKAFPRKDHVDANYIRLAQILLDRAQALPPADSGGRTPPMPAIATHDEKIVAAVKAYAAGKKIPREYFEFQMLYGIRRELQEQLAAEGYAVRVYVPYGMQWYPYYMRRLAERPANVWFFVSNLFKR